MIIKFLGGNQDVSDSDDEMGMANLFDSSEEATEGGKTNYGSSSTEEGNSHISNITSCNKDVE